MKLQNMIMKMQNEPTNCDSEKGSKNKLNRL